MSISRPNAALLLAFCLAASADGADFYRLFQMAATNEQAAITSPLLVDTNNTGFKLTNVLLHLEALKPDGQPSGIRLGMSMEQVVAQWGKPVQIEPQWCLGGPCFFYRELQVHFGAGSNRVKAIDASVVDLAGTLPTWPTQKDCTRKIGKPSQRKYYAEGTHCYLVYQKPDGRIRLICADGKLMSIYWGAEPVE
jgi:hypothetical protein